MPQPAWFICTIAREGIHNWEICKEFKIWGVPSNGRKIGITSPKKGDLLVVYHAGTGIKALCEVNGEWKTPSTKEEAPWAGGIYRYGRIIPFRVLIEREKPTKISFIGNKMESTNINLNILRRGFGIISEKDGEFLKKLLQSN